MPVKNGPYNQCSVLTRIWWISQRLSWSRQGLLLESHCSTFTPVDRTVKCQSLIQSQTDSSRESGETRPVLRRGQINSSVISDRIGRIAFSDWQYKISWTERLILKDQFMECELCFLIFLSLKIQFPYSGSQIPDHNCGAAGIASLTSAKCQILLTEFVIDIPVKVANNWCVNKYKTIFYWCSITPSQTCFFFLHQISK